MRRRRLLPAAAHDTPGGRRCCRGRNEWPDRPAVIASPEADHRAAATHSISMSNGNVQGLIAADVLAGHSSPKNSL